MVLRGEKKVCKIEKQKTREEKFLELTKTKALNFSIKRYKYNPSKPEVLEV